MIDPNKKRKTKINTEIEKQNLLMEQIEEFIAGD